MILEIIPDTDSRLHTPVPEYDFASQPTSELVRFYKDFMHTFEALKAYGLAANQCGLSYRMFLLASESPDDLPLDCVNPSARILSEQTVTDTEGCLSFPNLWLDIERPLMIEAEWTTILGSKKSAIMTGTQARGFLHELDHLNGIVFTSHVSRLKLDMARKKRKKTLRPG